MAPKEEKKEVEPLSVVLKRAGKKALGGGIAGALAMVAQVALLMWMRTVMNYQHANGLSTMEAIAALYAEGGITRLYQGWQVALLQAPVSRFGDTAANAGMLALCAGITWMPEGVKTFFASWAAAGFRIFITPMDAFKTTLQVHGPAGLTLLTERIASEGVLTLWSGALATAFATFAGHYPWFVTNNYLEAKIPAPSKDKVVTTMFRRAFIGLCSSVRYPPPASASRCHPLTPPFRTPATAYCTSDPHAHANPPVRTRPSRTSSPTRSASSRPRSR